MSSPIAQLAPLSKELDQVRAALTRIRLNIEAKEDLTDADLEQVDALETVVTHLEDALDILGTLS